MNKQEAVKLLALIKVAYPTAYRDMDEASKKATVNMWQMSFPDIPYPIMEQALNHFRMLSKFPPTVADMVEELKHVYYQALEQSGYYRLRGDREMVEQCLRIISYTNQYRDAHNLGGLNINSLQGRLGGEKNVYGLGTSGDNLCAENRLSLLDAGR